MGKKNDGNVINIYVDEDGCFAGREIKADKKSMKSVINSSHSKYHFWGNKGFYQDVDLGFVLDVSMSMKFPASLKALEDSDNCCADYENEGYPA